MNARALKRTSRVEALHPPRPARPASAGSLVGIVAKAADGAYEVRSGNITLQARRAASCLLDAGVGDTVHCLHLSEDASWILDVLRRADDRPCTVRLPANATLEAQDGQLSLSAAELSMKTARLRVDADESVFASRTTEVIGEGFQVIGQSFKLVGKVFHGVMERVSHYSRHYLRTTEGLDRVQGATVEVNARQLMRVSGEHSLIEGEKLIKARGAQIHLG